MAHILKYLLIIAGLGGVLLLHYHITSSRHGPAAQCADAQQQYEQQIRTDYAERMKTRPEQTTALQQQMQKALKKRVCSDLTD